MKGKDKRVICYLCGEKIDPELATKTEEGFFCDECNYQSEEGNDEEELDDDDEELVFYDDENVDDNGDYDELDFCDDDLADD